jgi:hypothetical protein
MSFAPTSPPLSLAQLSGDSDIEFSVNFALLNTSAHLYGGRMYAQLKKKKKKKKQHTKNLIFF